MNDAITVTQFVEVVNFTLEAVDTVVVEGEVDEFKIIHNKWVTFSLKDEESTVRCFMTLWQYKTQIEDGMLVKATGKPRLRNQGFFSFVVDAVEPSGEGALKRAFDLLQKKLTAEGLFSSERKRALPRFPQHIALITSRDAAAYADFLKVLQGRIGGLTVSFIHTQVQGTDAVRQILLALETANTDLQNLDVIVLVRGGGSLEDLQAFNSEDVVRAVAASRTPTVVGIGHERDVTLAELAADVRASTPSNAAELLVRSRQEILSDISGMRMKMSGALKEQLVQQQHMVSSAMNVLRGRVVQTASQVREYVSSLKGVGQRLRQATHTHREQLVSFVHTATQRLRLTVGQRRDAIKQLQRVVYSFSPEHTLQRGYSITRLADGTVIRSNKGAVKGMELVTTLADGSITSTVKDKS